MQAAQTKVQPLIDGERQYVIPLFQRPYSWGPTNWDMLWNDLAELCEESNPRPHFIGSIVTMPAKMVPQGVAKYILIDGQQRLTTLLVLLAAVRDRARIQPGNLADKIDDVLLKNRHQDGPDRYKLLPSKDDRPAFHALMDAASPPGESRVTAAYRHFEKKLRLAATLSLETLYNAIRNSLVLVSIVLDPDDNPHLIFESLNAKGEPLTQADLIRNFFFMRIHATTQEKVFETHWRPMQDRLGPALTEFIRHYLMRDGQVVKQGDVYLTLKERIDGATETEVIEYLRDLARSSDFYAKLLRPEAEPCRPVGERLTRLNRLEMTTAYPFLLNAYSDYDGGCLSAADFAVVLDMVENFALRRFVCGVVTSGLTRIFPALYAQAKEYPSLVEGVRHVLKDKSYPRDDLFRQAFVAAKLYGGQRSAKGKLILERLEQSFGHKEAVDLNKLSIEHVLPQSPSDWWRSHLGDDWEAVHEEWLHTIGNLTLTGYNSELSNSDFPTKKAHLAKSHLELNRHFAHVEQWDDTAVLHRGELLAERAVQVWPDFALRGRATGDEGMEAEEVQEDVALLIAGVLDHFGGEAKRVGSPPRVFYHTADGKVIIIKHSKRHPSYFWYGFHASLLTDLTTYTATHVVLILVPDSFVAVPVQVTRDYLADAGTSPKADGSVRHYHILVSTDPKPELFHHGKPNRIPLKEYQVKYG